MRVVFVRIAADPLDVRLHLNVHAEISATRHLEHAVRAVALLQPHVVVADANLPPWDVSVLQERVDQRGIALLLVDAKAHPAELAVAIEASLPRQGSPRM